MCESGSRNDIERKTFFGWFKLDHSDAENWSTCFVTSTLSEQRAP